MASNDAKKIKVALVAPSMKNVGGQSIQAERLREAFTEDEEIKLSFIPNDPETAFENVKFLRTIFTSIKFFFRLLGEIPRTDIVHIFSSGTTSYLISTLPPLFVAKLFGKKTILNYHTGEAETHLENWRLTAKPTMRMFDRIVVPSEFLVAVFARFDLKSEAIFNFVESEKFKFRDRNPLKPNFLSNRNFEAHYQVADVLRAFQLIQQKIPAAKLIVAGYGSEEEKLKKLAQDLKLENTEFLGRVEQSRMPEIYDRADVYLNSSIVDNMPLSIIEAFACGLPVVSTDAGGIPYIIEKGEPAVSTETGAHHYRFIGIEFAASNNDYVYNLLFFGEPQNVADAAHHIEIDRCYFHPFKSGITRRAVALNSQQTTIKNSYFAGFGYPQQEAQAICGWTGTKDIKILNNYIEGGAENILIGGADPASADLIPADIEIRGNHFNKPLEWKGKASTKCLFELKNAKRVQFVGNYLENNWEGSAFRITIRNQDGKAPFSTIEDVLIKDNIVNGAGEGINILGKDDTYESQTMKRVNILNNVFLNIGGDNWVGSGYFVQIADGEDILIANNTVFNLGNITSFHDAMPRGFVFRDNIVGHGNYGIHGFDNLRSPAGQKAFQNNIIVNNRGVTESDTSFPAGNFWIRDYKYVGFTDAAQNDFRLSPVSRFHGKGKDGTDIGSSLTAENPAK